MISAAALAAYTVAISFGLPRAITAVRRLAGHPRLAMTVWLTACASAVVSAVLAGLQLAAPVHGIGDELAALVTACGELLAGHALTDGPRTLATAAGLLIACAVVVRTVLGVGGALARARRERAAHGGAVRLVARHDPRLGAYVVDHAEAAAYCVPGRDALIVITTGALDALTPAQVAAVLAHERAHVAGRHHLLLAVAHGLARAFPTPLFVRAAAEVTRLV
ncbi:M48 family metalloprotease, partial [Nonomuraea longicatena]